MAPAWTVREATAQDAAAVHGLIRWALDRPYTLEPPAGATPATVAEIATWITDNGALVALEDRRGIADIAAVACYSHRDDGFWLRRAVVRTDLQGVGLAGLLIAAAEGVAARGGHREMRVALRKSCDGAKAYWQGLGFRHHRDHDWWVELRRQLPVEAVLATPEDTRALGRRLASLTRAGDLLLLSGDLGAGKTTLTQGIGEGLGVRGAVTSPTFVIARVHPSLGDGPPLVHVDAYRLRDLAEVDDLDLVASLDDSVTVIEWGEGLVEGLAEDRLELVLRRPVDDTDETRTVWLRGIGARWVDVGLATVAHGPLSDAVGPDTVSRWPDSNSGRR
jgi:tRNA threonylcarbamoyladenosine biosynthesis protein TsaE